MEVRHFALKTLVEARMPRKHRLHVPGGLYHVTLRGNDRQPIFHDDSDRAALGAIAASGLERYDCRAHAFCWMTNHIHLAIQVGELPLGRLMQWLASHYARAFNRRLGRTGHLFEKRHGAVLVETDAYLLALVRYIHCNPVQAGMVSAPEEYRWSSYRTYLGMAETPWLTTRWVLAQFGGQTNVARRRFACFVSSSESAEPSAHFETGGKDDTRVLGGDDFAEKMFSRCVSAKPVDGTGLATIIVRVCRQFGVDEAALVSCTRNRRNAQIRAMIAREATRSGAATVAEVARRFDRTESVIHRAMQRYAPNLPRWAT